MNIKKTVKIKKITPTFHSIYVTSNEYSYEDRGGVIIGVGEMLTGFDRLQKVVAVGPDVKGIKVGDLVCIDYNRYRVKKFDDVHSIKGEIQDNKTVCYEIPSEEVGGEQLLRIYDSDIMFVVDECEEVDESGSDIIMPDKSIII